MRLFYTFLVLLYSLGVRIAAIFNEKAKKWVAGRKDVFQYLDRELSSENALVWVHSASLGEYEQAKPLVEKIKNNQPGVKILVTFFSPSGYEQAVKEKDKRFDYACYLPVDTMQNAKKFVNAVRPKAAIFVKYEFWFNYMNSLHSNGIPFYYISAIFRENQYFFKTYGRWFAKQLKLAEHFFVQNRQSCDLLKNIGIEHVTICGDTRFDRVKKVADEMLPIDVVDVFANGCKLIVAGSTWQPDETLLSDLLKGLDGYKLVVAPHEINRKNEVLDIFSQFRTVCYTSVDNEKLPDCEVLVIDTVGLLKHLYRYATVSYVGGAFKTGLHNTLEAAVYGKPLFFGPKYDRFVEAVSLVEMKGAFAVKNASEMKSIIDDFDMTPSLYGNTCRICEDYVKGNVGACDLIYNEIENIFENVG